MLLSRQATDMSDSSSPTPDNANNINPSLRCCRRTAPEEAMKDVRRSVKGISFGGWEEKAASAAEIARLAKADAGTKRLIAELGVVPPLVAMLVESNDERCRRAAVEALAELASGTFRNKKLIAESGLLSKLPQLMHNQSFARDRQFVHLLLAISSLAKAQYPLKSNHFLPFLIDILNADDTTEEVKLTSVATLYNLSTKLDNARTMVASGIVPSLLKESTNKRASEGALATLGNLVTSNVGKKAIEDDPLVIKNLMKILAWDDKPKCQELATYLLMVVADGGVLQREKLSVSGIIPLLLEVALLGTPLARKRALKLLQWFKDERRPRIEVHSGPQAARIPLQLRYSVKDVDTEEGRRAVKSMVKQSLDKNMESIMRRATGIDASSVLKALVTSSSSKSLPY